MRGVDVRVFACMLVSVCSCECVCVCARGMAVGDMSAKSATFGVGASTSVFFLVSPGPFGSPQSTPANQNFLGPKFQQRGGDGRRTTACAMCAHAGLCGCLAELVHGVRPEACTCRAGEGWHAVCSEPSVVCRGTGEEHSAGSNCFDTMQQIKNNMQCY